MDKEFIEDLKNQFENLERGIKEMKELFNKIADKPSFIEIRAAASILHDFYSGIEKIFERIAIYIDNNLPKGEEWHRELLEQMAKPFGKRKAIINDKLFQRLKEYMRFRHLFRHIYGFELDWERFKSLCYEMEDVYKEVKFEIEKILDKLAKD